MAAAPSPAMNRPNARSARPDSLRLANWGNARRFPRPGRARPAHRPTAERSDRQRPSPPVRRRSTRDRASALTSWLPRLHRTDRAAGAAHRHSTPSKPAAGHPRSCPAIDRRSSPNHILRMPTRQLGQVSTSPCPPCRLPKKRPERPRARPQRCKRRRRPEFTAESAGKHCASAKPVPPTIAALLRSQPRGYPVTDNSTDRRCLSDTQEDRLTMDDPC